MSNKVPNVKAKADKIEYNNVSVRLDEGDYSRLEFLFEKFNRIGYGKVPLADVLRHAVNELYFIELQNNNVLVAFENRAEYGHSIEESAENFLKQIAEANAEVTASNESDTLLNKGDATATATAESTEEPSK